MTQRIYTRTGDRGETGLFGGGRVPKHHMRVEAYGTVDELNACLGWALTVVTDSTIVERMALVQPDLFTIGADGTHLQRLTETTKVLEQPIAWQAAPV